MRAQVRTIQDDFEEVGALPAANRATILDLNSYAAAQQYGRSLRDNRQIHDFHTITARHIGRSASIQTSAFVCICYTSGACRVGPRLRQRTRAVAGGVLRTTIKSVATVVPTACGANYHAGWPDLSPNQLGPHLKLLWFFVFDRKTGEFTARLASCRAMIGFQQSFRGTPLRDLHPPHILWLSQAHMTKAVSDPATYHCSGTLFKAGSQIVEGERIILPLASDNHQGDGVLGATDFPMRPGTGPVELLAGDIRWLSI